MFYFQDEVQIDDINKMFFDDYLKRQIILYVNTNLGKKPLRKFRLKIKDNSFYPIHIIRENRNDTDKIKQNKLQSLEKENEKLFKKRYRQVAYKKFGVNSLLDIEDKIKVCPFCKHEKVGITHNYSKGHTDCALLFKCDSCNQILDIKSFFRIIDAQYAYSKTINNYLNLYCKNYDKEFIEKKIFDELKNTEIINW